MKKRAQDADPNAVIRRTLTRQTNAAIQRRMAGEQTPGGSPVLPDKTRGIAFSLALTQAIVAGRKTQTRRLLRPQPEGGAEPDIADCPVAAAGEWLHVREPWLKNASGTFQYAADGLPPAGGRFKPGMYMPRAAARHFLLVTNVAAERVQSMSPEDAAAEGVAADQDFESLWDTFYTRPGERFADNPWVWVLHFQLHRPA